MSKLSEEILAKITRRIIKYKLTANDIFDVASQLHKLGVHKAIGEHIDEMKSEDQALAAIAETEEDDDDQDDDQES